jgi:hypothetical protein
VAGQHVSEGGVHMHHLFFGIVLMMAAGGLSFAAGETDGPWYAIYAVLFGVGFGLAIDEYALWLHLDDVYWSHEGRSSIDAALIALGLIVFVLLAFRAHTDRRGLVRRAGHHGGRGDAALRPGADRRREAPSRPRPDRHLHPWLPAYAALRLAKPSSLWAKRFYGERRPDKQARSERLTDRCKERLRDAIGGVTEEQYQARLAAAAPPTTSGTTADAPVRKQ